MNKGENKDKSKDNGKRLSRYLDDLSEEEIMNLKRVSLPWQRNFLLRFYEQLKKQELQKKDIVNKVEELFRSNNNHPLLKANYKLPETTLVQYTSLLSDSLRPIKLSNLIAVSEALGVSVHYLLGIDECETPENTNIYKATGLNNETIEILKNNKNLQEQLNLCFQSSKLEDLSKALDKEFTIRLVERDLLEEFSEELLAKIESAYDKYEQETILFDRGEEKYAEYLKKEIPFESFMGKGKGHIKEYLNANLSINSINNIYFCLESPNPSDSMLYDGFINLIAKETYELCGAIFSNDYRLQRISQMFLLMAEDFIQAKLEQWDRDMLLRFKIKTVSNDGEQGLK